MRPIEILRSTIKEDYFSDSEVSALFGNGPTRYNKIHQMIDRGELIRLKNGAYHFDGIYCRTKKDNLFYLANMLFGPSYVSLESALSFYSLIPEAVYSVTSVTVKRTKTYNTPLGIFLYSKIPYEAFPEGVYEYSAHSGSTFLFATREKALLDKMYLSSGVTDLYSFCIESLRIELSDLRSLDQSKLVQIAALYNATFRKRVEDLVKKLQD